MSIETIFDTMDYGTAPEDRGPALQWIKNHGGIAAGLEDTLILTMKGIAAGMQNTG